MCVAYIRSLFALCTRHAPPSNVKVAGRVLATPYHRLHASTEETTASAVHTRPA